MSRALATFLIILAAPTAVASSVQLQLGDHDFEWTSVEQERARFGWWADVVNDTSRSFEVEVVLELLDEEDQLVHDDSVIISVGAEETRRASHDASMPFDRAADVASLRFRLNPRPPEREPLSGRDAAAARKKIGRMG